MADEPYDPAAARRAAKIREEAARKQKAVEDAAARVAAEEQSALEAEARAREAKAERQRVLEEKRAAAEAERTRVLKEERTKADAVDQRKEVFRARLHHIPTHCDVQSWPARLPPALPAAPAGMAISRDLVGARARAEHAIAASRHPEKRAPFHAQLRELLGGRLQPDTFVAWLHGAVGLSCARAVLPEVAALLPGGRARREALLMEHGAAELRHTLRQVQRNSRSSRRVDLRGRRLGDAGALSLAAALRTNRRVRSLLLRDNAITMGGTRALCTALRPGGVMHEAAVAAENPPHTLLGRSAVLARLDLSDNDLRSGGAAELATLLRAHPTLRELELGGNSLGSERTGDAGVVALAEALGAGGSGLRTLGLGSNGLGKVSDAQLKVGVDVERDERFALYVRKLEIGVRLVSLKKLMRRARAQGKQFTREEPGPPLFSATDIAALELYWDKRNAVVSDEAREPGFRALCAALCASDASGRRRGPPLRTLAAPYNCVGPTGARALASVLQISRTLRRVDLSNNATLGDAGAAALAEGLVVVHDSPQFKHALRALRESHPRAADEDDDDDGEEEEEEDDAENEFGVHDASRVVRAMELDAADGGELGAFDAVEVGAFARYAASLPVPTELRVPHTLVRLRAMGGGHGPADTELTRPLAKLTLVKGCKVCARYRGAAAWYPATVARAHLPARAAAAAADGGGDVDSPLLFDLHYDEVELAAGVKAPDGRRTIEELDLSHCQLGVPGAGSLACGLLSHPASLTVLELSGNRIGALGTRRLALALRDNTSLTSLGLAANGIGVEGAVDLAEALQSNRALVRLDLSFNKLGGDVVDDHQKRALVEVQESIKRQGDVAARFRRSAQTYPAHVTNMRANKTIDLRYLAPSAQALGRTLGHNRTLTQLELVGNDLGLSGVEALVGGLMRNPVLTALGMGNNSITAEGTLMLAQLLDFEGCCLERVQLSGKVMLPSVERGDADWLTSLELAESTPCYW